MDTVQRRTTDPESRAVTTRPAAWWALVAVEVLTAVAALYGGIGLIADNSIQMKDEWLIGTPFDSWVLPGILLLLVVAAPMITAATAEIGHRSWAYRASLVAGAAQVGWIGAQWLIFREYFILQPVMLGIGIAVLALAWWVHHPRPVEDSHR